MISFWIILKHELKLSLTNISRIVTNFLFFIILSSIFTILSKNFVIQENNSDYLTTIILFCLVSSSIFINSTFLNEDFEDGTLEQISRKIENLETYITAKILNIFIINNLPIIISTPAIIALSGITLDPKNLIVTLTLTALTINFISCLSGSLCTIKNSAPISAIIMLPLIIPILILSFNQITSPTENLLTTLTAITLLSISLTTLAASKIAKILLE
ncbi:MAG: heme exporter protein CcmB [Rickettsiales bacterium]|nr:heme exporter protein CcmB [Rickettsiales bacterium]